MERIKIESLSGYMEWSWDQLAASSPWCLTPVGGECLGAGPLPGQRGRVYTDIPVALLSLRLRVLALLPGDWSDRERLSSLSDFIHSTNHSSLMTLLAFLNCHKPKLLRHEHHGNGN